MLTTPSPPPPSRLHPARPRLLQRRAQDPRPRARRPAHREPRGRRAPVDDVRSASGLPVGERKSQVFGHAEFMETYADLRRTRLRSGENPLVDTYKNVKFLF